VTVYTQLYIYVYSYVRRIFGKNASSAKSLYIFRSSDIYNFFFFLRPSVCRRVSASFSTGAADINKIYYVLKTEEKTFIFRRTTTRVSPVRPRCDGSGGGGGEPTGSRRNISETINNDAPSCTGVCAHVVCVYAGNMYTGEQRVWCCSVWK